jgi:hypothetical protein
MSDEHTITGERRPASCDVEIVSNLFCDMLFKLEKNSHKSHWNTVTNAYLLKRMKEEILELENALNGDGEDACLECADVANFAAMIYDNVKHGVGTK